MYCSPTRFWQTKMPSAVRPEDFEAGEVSPVVHLGTGTGSLVVVRAYPKDAWQVTLRITLQGELGQARFVFTLDGSAWSAEQLVPADGAWALFGFGPSRLADAGVGLRWGLGSASPSFLVGDIYSFGTTASPAILGAIQEVEDELDEVLSDDLVLPLLNIGRSLPGKVGTIAAWRALSQVRGFDPGSPENKPFRMNYEDAQRWADDIREKRRKLRAQEGGAPINGIRMSSLYPSGWGTLRGRERC